MTERQARDIIHQFLAGATPRKIATTRGFFESHVLDAIRWGLLCARAAQWRHYQPTWIEYVKGCR